ncbi:MAG: hypothetical protein HETSPECPRED_001377 [Heterodermia speciosa]|uniref:Beta-catenin-like protein 1 N-terminal domain-containing protein n=1 Tax=Heterodermia speciosa TaxID=116794 RepID=A0A8H3EWW4_9LECA|nr:MAG: hypothetical protein HETSPECPRED_001377 [Heterodermia speciosa]
MSSIDDLFKKPSLPSNKRKFEITQNPDAIYKATKLSANGDVKSNGRATVEEEDDDDGVAGPELPPEEDGIDDEEGRFFGGGINNDTAEVLDFIEEREKEDTLKAEKIDLTWVRRLALNFEKKITRNSELRAKFESTPQKFMGSEADLDADIKAISILSEHSELYEEFAKLGCVASLVSLLSHENTDISIDAIEIINELTDEDVEAEQAQWDALVDAMLEANLLNLLYENLQRFDESIESDRSGVYHVLGVVENLASRISIAETLGKETSIIQWLSARIQRQEPTVSQNTQYAAEVLAILLQSSVTNRLQLVQQDGIDLILQLLSPYRKRDPLKGTEEEEYVENLFDCITCCVDDKVGKEKFLQAEGVELCLIMLRDGKMSKPRALRLLDHALGGQEGAACCEKLVEAAGLKVVFSMLMKKPDAQTTEHLLGLLASMLRSLPADSAPRIRLLAKFVEKDYEKIERLIKIRREYASRVSVADRNIKKERADLSVTEQGNHEDEWLSQRLDAGLFTLQTVDVILAWLAAEDDGARKKMRDILADRDESFDDISASLQEQLNSMDAGAGSDDPVMKDVLNALIQHLD